MYFEPPEQLLSYIRNAQRIVIVTHIYPDGDAIGSEVALAEGLIRLAKDVKIWNCHQPPERLQFLDSKGLVEVIPKSRIPTLCDCDLILSVDTSEFTRLGDLGAYVKRSNAKKAVCDHHISAESHSFDVVWDREDASSTGIMILDLLAALGIAPSARAATALFAAIASDTGWFTFSNTTSREFSAASRLTRLGACPVTLCRQLMGNVSLEVTALLGEVLASVRSEFSGRFIWSSITRRQMADKGVKYKDLDGVVDHLKNIRKAQVAALIVEVEDGKWKVSLRGPVDVPVNPIAKHFGGGGHAKAAGYRIPARDINEVLKGLRPQVAKLLEGFACNRECSSFIEGTGKG